MDRKYFSNRLQEAMTFYGMSSAELCRITGIHPSDISRYLSAERSPNSYKLIVLSEALNVDPRWLMGMESKTKKLCHCPWCGKELPNIGR